MQEKKPTGIPSVSAREDGKGQTESPAYAGELWFLYWLPSGSSQGNLLERSALEGDSPVLVV